MIIRYEHISSSRKFDIFERTLRDSISLYTYPEILVQSDRVVARIRSSHPSLKGRRHCCELDRVELRRTGKRVSGSVASSEKARGDLSVCTGRCPLHGRAHVNRD